MTTGDQDRRGPDRPHLGSVLVVDDSSTTRRILRRGLEGAGYAVLEAADGEEGLALCRAARPDLVLLDVDMPVLDGPATLRAMRADPALRSLPVLFLTARTAGGEVAHGLDLGADDYLKKPCDPAELVARVGTALRRRDREVQLRQRAEDLDMLSTTDQLTGLGNRRHLDAQLTRLSAAGGPSTRIGVVLLDIDHFKQVNDTHGHAVGDVVLAVLANRLRGALDEHDDTLVRWGGEEFLALSPGGDPAAVEALAERLRLAVRAGPVVLGEAVQLEVTVSAGAAAGRLDGFDALARAADAALYQAKAAGRDRVQLG